MRRKPLYDLAHVCTLVLVPGVAAWIIGQPLIFPSLGPSAFALVLDENENRARRVIGGHLIGVVSGLIAYHALAHGLSLAALAPAPSADGLRLVASGVVSIALTTAAMLAARANHAPACATTLIVSLGVLPGFLDGALIMAAVAGMFLTHRLVMLVRK
ncbi:MAG: HPP family protein [Thermoguttaceae bacterium]